MDSQGGGSLFMEDFGQKVDLTRRIREVLVNYPEGTTVLKELVQNADDAGATKICLCLDRRVHGIDSLLSESLAQWQGPALLAYNDSVFSEEDFVSISRIGDSKKQGQAWKTGRFGVGFNSVYHLTDLPSFVSGKYVVLFDPQGIHLPNVSAANPGKRLDYVSSSAISLYSDQFLPYCGFGCDMRRPFSGTLFRFPLRSADQAATSKLSRQVYSENDIISMFNQFYDEAVFSLLFLKSVTSIEMYTWDANAIKPQKLYSCFIQSPANDIVFHRQAILRLSKSVKSSTNQIDSFSLNFSRERLCGTSLEKRTDTFYIVDAMASSSSRIGIFAENAAKEHGLHLLPWAAVAACITDGLAEDDSFKDGRAFCFLPLPIRTGLTVQVNGYFELSSNRRSIWFGADMDRGGKLRSDWNMLLLEDVVSVAFNELLLSVRKFLGPTQAYYSLWPYGSFDEPWNILVRQFYRHIVSLPVVYSGVEGGKWMSLSEAFIHDRGFAKSELLYEALILLEMPVVSLSNSLVDMLFNYAAEIHQRLVSPNTVRHFLKQAMCLTALPRDYKLVLLEYCLDDLIDADVGKLACGLPLVPLASGEFGIFSESSNMPSYFIGTDLEYELLAQITEFLIDRNIPLDLYSRLSNIAKTSGANIGLFCPNFFLHFLDRFMPYDWKCQDIVVFEPENNVSHPSACWFVIFWQYLREQCDDLSIFHEWPIFPVLPRHLCRASKTSRLTNAANLSDTLKNILVKIGCKILNLEYQIGHPQLTLYIHEANGAGILDAIFDAVTSSCEGLLTIFQKFSPAEKDELRQYLLDPKWYLGYGVSKSYINKCMMIPMYRVYSEGSTDLCVFSDLEWSRKFLPPLGVADCLLGNEFIKCLSNSEEDILSRYYGIQHMERALFYKQKVLTRTAELLPEVRDSLMLSILQDLPQLCVQDPTFRETLRSLEFVPTLSENLKCPQVLYDPRNEELYALLEDSGSFPCGKFQDPEVLDMLQSLGLQTAVSLDAVVESARQIELLMHADPMKAYSRGKVLLSYLEVNANKWLPNNSPLLLNKMLSKVAMTFKSASTSQETNLAKFWNDLRMICWCPVMASPPYAALPWPTATSTVAPPKLVRLQEDMWLVSASMRLLDGGCSSTSLSVGLGWSCPPGGNIIAAQLLELGKNNENVTDQILRQELALAMPKIYAILMAMIGKDEMDIVKAILEGSRWIWVGDGFATVDEVVLSGPFHLAPYVRVIPIDLAVFRDFFLELGIRETLKPADYSNILSKMATRNAGKPLNQQELRAALMVVQHLAEIQFQDQNLLTYLPNVSSRLMLASELVYNDAPWLLDSENGSLEEDSMASTAKSKLYNFVHNSISNDVAGRFGVRSLRRLLLAESADSMNLGLSDVAEAFGQHEALTTRLKHILEMYADGPGILFELVQNADDAGASEVVFLLDRTQYGTSSILSPEMADWQGPALYCFNDSVFSPQDLHAISRIGQDSKFEKPFTIGRFGLGFNCVYHFTDIPGFVSGENIVIFDPHACNLPGISPANPGLRIKFVGRTILEQFPDQFSPFLHFGCDLKHPFPGTLFRFPLRNKNAASRSHIKKESYSPEDVCSLFSSFTEAVVETLLFLRNVKTISIFVKDGLSHEMLLVHRVSRHNIQQSSKPQSIDPLLDFIHGKQQNSLDKVQFYEKLSKVVDIDLPWYCEKVVLNEQTPSGGKLHFWIKSECLGGGHAKVLSVTSENRSLNFIPWASVAAYLHSCDRNALEDWLGTEREINDNLLHQFQLPATSLQRLSKFEGRAFCFLPLPISTGLPVHINSYFELSSNRRDIWFGNDMTGCGKVRSDWNISLLEDVAAPAYGYLLAEIAKEIGPCDLYFSFWPTEVGLEPWASMVRKFYSCITGLQLHILYSKVRGGQWVSAKQAVFPDYTFSETVELSEVLSEAGLPLVSVSQQLVEHFMRSCPGLHFLTPQLLRTLLIRRKRGFKNHDAMILTLKYCLSDIQEPIVSDKLYGLPLLPLATGQFAVFTKRGQGEKIFVTTQNEYDLLKDFVPHLLVDLSISEDIFGKLQSIAQAGDSNLSSLTCYLLEGLLIKVLPAEWKQTKQVVWNPGHQGHPSVDWMGLLWTYLKLSCNDLSIFAPWPILPTGNGYLFQIVKDSNVIKDDGWSENMYSLLQKVGCIFLRSDLGIDHPQLSDFVQDASASGVLNAFLAISGEVHKVEELLGSALDGERRELRSFLLQSKWFQGDQMKPLHIDLIKSLPIFETYRSRNFVSLQNPVKWLRPEGLHEDLMDDNFIRSEADREKAILKSYLYVKEPSKIEFYQDNLLNRMSDFILHPNILSTILHDINLFIKEDSDSTLLLSEIPFVLTANGSWQPPSKLYDPRVPGLLKLLNRETFFPSEEFLKANALDTLVSFGLQRCLSFKGLLDCARSVSICNPEDNEALHGGKRLLACLDAVAFELEKTKENEGINKLHDPISLHETEQLTTTGDVSPGKVYEAPPSGLDLDIQTCLHSMVYDQSEQEFWSELLEISWCPVYINPPVEGLPWSACSTRVAPPNLVRPKSQMWLVSFTTRILDGECFSEYLQEKIGWSKVPDISVLSFQLVEISKSYCQAKMQSDGRRQIPDALLQEQIPTLYSKLQEYVGKDDFEVLKSALDGVPWVWIGDNFILPNALAFDSPVKYHPYLYAVPSELSRFRVLLSNLGVKDSFDLLDYIQVLQRVQCDMNGSPLSAECLSFVHRVLEAVADFYADKSSPDALVTSLLVPDSNGVLTRAADLVYNDAPWMDKIALEAKKLVHPTISNDLAGHLGLQSLRFMSLVNENMTRHLPCMDYGKVHELLELYGDDKFLIFDLLELADCCKATKLHVIFDKRDHPRLSLLQHNLGEFQGPAVTVVLEGVTLSMQEVCNLHLLPPWKLQGTTLTYGLGLLSCYWISNLQVITSGGALYMFDPHGSVLSPTQTASGKMYSLFGTNLMERFRDQFQPMFINEKLSCSAADSTIIRMPLSLQCMSEGLESGSKRIMGIFENFIAHASSSLLFLKSVLEVSLSTWEEQNSQPCQDFSVHIDPSSSVLRNPFPEKKWRKFQISRLFNSSSPATKLYTIDVHVSHGGNEVTKKWFVVLSLGSGQTRNMALDRRYLSYNLTPVAGIAALLSENGQPASVHTSSCILSPLPLSGSINMPVTAVGYFLVCHNGGRHLFRSQDGPSLTFSQIDMGNQLIVSWNKELMSCVRDSYVEMILEFQRLKRDPLTSLMDSGSAHAVSLILHAYAERVYSFWPRSWIGVSSCKGSETANLKSLKAPDADWRCLIEQVISPFYARLVAQPVWQLYSGGFVKAEEGMFLSQPESGLTDPFSLTTIYSFIKEHYPVFSVPSDLVREIQSVGISVKEIKPKMVRDLLKASSISTIRSVETYIDVLDYSVCDIKLDLPSSSDAEAPREQNTLQQMNMEQLPGTSNSNRDVNAPRWSTSMSTSHYTVTRRASGSDDAFDMVTSLGKALLDFGRGVVEDIGRSGTFSVEREGIPPVAAELKGLPFPTATRHLVKLGTYELWIGNKDQLQLMFPLAGKFIHPQCLERKTLASFFCEKIIQRCLKLQVFSPLLLSTHLRLIFGDPWVKYVMDTCKDPWVIWGGTTEPTTWGPSCDWIQLFWRNFSGSPDDLLLFSDWPLIPAFLSKPVLCRVKDNQLVFIPPITQPPFVDVNSNHSTEGNDILDNPVAVSSESVNVESYIISFEEIKSRYPWLLPLMNRCGIPVYDMAFFNCGAPSCCFPKLGQSLGKTVASKLVIAKDAGYLLQPVSLADVDKDELFSLFSFDFTPHGSSYSREELDLLKILPMFKTVTGTYVDLLAQEQCIVSSGAFFQPYDVRCLSQSIASSGKHFLSALGVPELHNRDILVKFALPGFENKTEHDQEYILMYIYLNWGDLQSDTEILDALKETKFVQSAEENSTELFKPKELLDPSDPLLKSVFAGERKKFPGEKFSADGWLRILKKTGLQTVPQADVMLECARKVEFLGSKLSKTVEDAFMLDSELSKSDVTLEIWSLAGSVVEAILKHFPVLYGNNFCSLLSNIAFVPAEMGLPSIDGKNGGKKVLSSYNNAILLRDWPLAWSCKPIISRRSYLPPEFSWGALHLRSPPTFSTVLRHLQVVGSNSGEETLAHWPTSRGVMSIEEASCEVLKYLDRVWDSLSTSDVSELKKVAFIPVANGTRLVTANCLFVHLQINLSPLAFELPALYLPFVNILKVLGLQEVLSVACAKGLLAHMRKSWGYHSMNPNEFRAVMEILHFICNEAGQDITEESGNELDEAIIPDDGRRLVLARSCVYIDPYGSRFISSIDVSSLRFVHPAIPERICAFLGVKKLSDIVIEELDQQQPIEFVDQIGSVSLRMLKDKIQNKEFHVAVWAMFNSSKNHADTANGFSQELISDSLNSLAENLKFVHSIYTRFLLLPKLLDITRSTESHVPGWGHGPGHRALHFVSRSKTVILVAEPPSFLSIFDTIAVAINEVLGVPNSILIGPLLAAPESSLMAILYTLKLGNEKEKIDYGGSEQLLGKEVTPQDTLQVQFHPLRPFYAGEFVAYRPQEHEKLRYGRVPENTRPSAGQALYRLPVETRPGETQSLLSSQIFSFKSVSAADGSTNFERIQMRKAGVTQGQTPQMGPEKMGSTSKELQHSPVSAAELVQAVQDMLSAVGMPMDVEKQTLLQTTLSLQEQLRESQTALLLEQERADTAAKEAETAKGAWSCRICLNNEVDMMIIPCGHVLCHRCSSAVSKCPFCRLQVSRTHRIYRP